MKTVFSLNIVIFLLFHSLSNAQAPRTYVLFNPNYSSAYLVSSGIFNNDIRTTNTPGFFWPTGANFPFANSSGLTIFAKVNGSVRAAGCSYSGEYSSGCIQNGNPYTSADFKFYKVNRNDGPSNPDWANWYKVVPFGAPYVDVNKNGTYEQGIDIPGIKDAKQTVFICMTDGFVSTHTSSEGLIGGTQPLFAEVRLTAWGYDNNGLIDAQFFEYEIINKASFNWDSVFFGLFCDVRVGDPSDDYLGCDTLRQMGYWYNSDNYDMTIGSNPPAAGVKLLQGAVKKNPLISYKMTSFVVLNGTSPCEGFPTGTYQNEVLNLLNGFKKDGSSFLNPAAYPHTPTKYCFAGSWSDPQWLNNCGTDTGQVGNLPQGSRKFLLNTGSVGLTVNPSDTQRIIFAQAVARGSNNLNSISKLNSTMQFVDWAYYANYVYHTISGTVKYSDNNQVVTSGIIKALRLNWFTLAFEVVDSAYIQTDGTYLLQHVPQDSVYIGLYPVTTPVRDFVPSYYPSNIHWYQATLLYPVENMNNINPLAIRMNNAETSNSVNGRVYGINDSGKIWLPYSVIYAKSGSSFVGCNFSDNYGVYHLSSLPAGTLTIIVDRMGFKSDSLQVNLSGFSNIDSVNFQLYKIYVGIHQNGESIPEKFILNQNYPNPFNPVTNIKFDLPGSGFVRLKIYNLLGQETAALIDQNMNAGSYIVDWNASSFPSGVYFCRITVTDAVGKNTKFSETKRMILLK